MMNPIASVEIAAQIGTVKMTGGVALYAGHIRQMDRDARDRRQRTQAPERVERLERE